jgi:hypothetical protein
MTDGSKPGSYILVDVDFPLFAVNPAYEADVIKQSELQWLALVDIFVERIDDEWSELQVKFILTLKRNDNGKKVAELITVCTYEVVAGQSMENKYIIVHHMTNQTAAIAQGAWRAKNNNESLATNIPQALDKWSKDSKEIKDVVKKKWNRWSRK